MLESLTDTSDDVKNELTAKKSAYMNEKSKLVEWKDVNAIPNLSFHVLVQDMSRALKDTTGLAGSYNRNFVSTAEFSVSRPYFSVKTSFIACFTASTSILSSRS